MIKTETKNFAQKLPSAIACSLRHGELEVLEFVILVWKDRKLAHVFRRSIMIFHASVAFTEELLDFGIVSHQVFQDGPSFLLGRGSRLIVESRERASGGSGNGTTSSVAKCVA